MTFILEAAAPADPAAAEPAAVADDAAGFVAAAEVWPPMICCSELNKRPKKLCAAPTGIGAAVALEEFSVGSNTEAFLWWPWPWDGIFSAGRLGVTAAGMLSDDIGYPFERGIVVERQ